MAQVNAGIETVAELVDRDLRLQWLAALVGFVVAVAAFYPGYMSWDSAYQWWQARHDQFDAAHPPLMAMIWQLIDRLIPGPGGMFMLQQLLIWGALAWFAGGLKWRSWQRGLLVLALGFWPPLFGLSAYLWKDLWTLLAFAWATAILVHELRTPSRALRIAALIAVIAACSFRLNAITGAVPFAVWLLLREWPGLRLRANPVKVCALTVVLSTMIWSTSQLPNLDSRVRPVDSAWSAVTLWDAASVSLSEGRLVFPPELIDSSLTLEELRGTFVDYSNGTVYVAGKLNYSLDGPYTNAERSALHRLAWSLPTQYPRSYFSHRVRLAELLYGWDQERLPDDQILWPKLHGYGDNPPLNPSRSWFQTWTAGRLQALIKSPFFAGWLYLILAVLVTAIGLRRRMLNPTFGLAAVVASSSLAYALPLALVSGSAEFRYMAWPLQATLIACALLTEAFRGTRNDHE